jgi:RimJ/RimL family protein N-acetyltransferase
VSGAPESFTTARLIARRVGPVDEEFLVAMWSDPRVVATLGGARDRGQVQQMMERLAEHWDTHGHGMWVLRDLGSEEPVGWTMLTITDTGGAGGVEVGWSTAADWRRQGLATEAAAAAVRIAFTELQREALVSYTLVDNVASLGVMRKLGFAYDSEVEHAGLPHVLYRLSKTDWEHRSHG